MTLKVNPGMTLQTPPLREVSAVILKCHSQSHSHNDSQTQLMYLIKETSHPYDVAPTLPNLVLLRPNTGRSMRGNRTIA